MPIFVLDLGGVLVQLDAERLRPVLRLGPEDWAQWLLHADAARDFDTGRSAPERFFAEAAAAVGAPGVDAATFGAAFQSWVVGWLPGAEALVRRLRGRGRVACLSNSNAAHWPTLQALGVPLAFDEVLLSWQLGVAKPDPAIFALAEARLGVPPAELVFVDDSPTNVAAAQARGWTAHLARGPEEAARALAVR